VVDDVADAALEGAHGFLLRLALGLLALVVDAAGGVVGDLGKRGGVDGVVELTVAAGLRRCRVSGPEEASRGAVPLWRA
jgi:hypothetical protein